MSSTESPFKSEHNNSVPVDWTTQLYSKVFSLSFLNNAVYTFFAVKGETDVSVKDWGIPSWHVGNLFTVSPSVCLKKFYCC